ncbi:unnamed protein product, partial [marine sediment metagenome]
MKYIIMILILLFVSSMIFAEIHGSISIAKHLQEPNANVNIKLNYSFDIFIFNMKFYGSWLTWFCFKDSLWAYPFRDIYEIGARVQYKVFFVDMNHFCNHAVYHGDNKRWYSNKWGEDLTTISLG